MLDSIVIAKFCIYHYIITGGILLCILSCLSIMKLLEEENTTDTFNMWENYSQDLFAKINSG